MSKSGDFVAGLIVGGLIGAVIGILYAPKSGKETREDIGRKADEFLAKAKEEYETAVAKSKKTYEAAVERLKHLEEKALKKAVEAEETLEGMAGQGRETLHEGKTRLKRAIEAGVDAFKEEQRKTV